MARLPSHDLETDASGPTFNFRRALKDIDDDLTSSDIASLKFLCRDFIPGSKLENAKGTLDVFRQLENKGLLGQTNLMFLAELLYRIQRADLLRKLRWNTRQVSGEIERGRALLSPFRVMLLQLSEELTTRDFDDMKFMAEAYISRNKLEMVNTFLSLAVALERGMYLTSDNVKVLHELLQTQERPDLKDIVQKYEASITSRSRGGKTLPDESFSPPPMSGDTTSQNRRPGPDPYHTQPETPANQQANLVAMTENMNQPAQQGYQQMLQTELMQQAGTVPNIQARQTARVAAQKPQTPPQGEVAGYGPAPADLQATIERELEKRLEQERARQREEMPCYRMDHNPRGLAVIVNNKNFFYDTQNPNSKPRLENRIGTDVDRDNLIYIFSKLGFEVSTWEDITHRQLIDLFSRVRQADHTNYDCFVTCILSHGSQGHVFGSDSVPVSIRDLAEEIKSSKCPSLTGKPKLFFIQACQGRTEQRGVSDIRVDAAEPGLDAVQETIPNEADFLLSFSTIPGYVSYRSKTHGSWFVTKLVETLDNIGDRHDLLSILIKVNEEVGKAIARKEQFKQSPAPVATLRKKIFFSFLREARRPQVYQTASTTNTAV